MIAHKCSYQGALARAIDWAYDLLKENAELRKIQTSAGAQRAFEWYSREVARQTALKTVSVEFTIHAGTGNCVCSQCEDARAKLDQIIRASK